MSRSRVLALRPVLWIEIPVWVTFAVCAVLWWNDQMSWWIALAIPTALEVLLFLPVWVVRAFRRRRLLRRYPRLRDGVR